MNGFLMLMSDGLYDVYGKVIETNVPQVCVGVQVGVSVWCRIFEHKNVFVCVP